MVTDTRGEWSDDSSVRVAEAWMSESFFREEWQNLLVLIKPFRFEMATYPVKVPFSEYDVRLR